MGLAGELPNDMRVRLLQQLALQDGPLVVAFSRLKKVAELTMVYGRYNYK